MGQKAQGIECDKEDDRSKNAARECNACAECSKNRPQRAPEDRIADAGERSDKTDLDTGECLLTDVCTVRTFLLHRGDDAHDRSTKERLRVEKFEMALECRLELIALIELLERRNQRNAEPHRLHTLEVEGAEQEVGTDKDPEKIFLV